MISEFRALRASVIKLWRAEWANADSADILPDLLRFNEAIDQIMTESLDRFTQKLTHSGSWFVGALANDFSGPLARVQDAAHQLLSSGNLSDEQVSKISGIETSSARVKQLASNLIDAVSIRLDKGLRIVPARMDVGTALREVVKEVQATQPARKLIVETSGDLRGEWDPARVAQMLSSLIGNALHLGLNNSPIDVAAEGSAEEVTVSVHNQGTMSPDEVASVFDPLPGDGKGNQTQSEKAKVALGLFIAQGIAIAHGGGITVTSNEEQGTTLAAHLPRKDLLNVERAVQK